MSWEDQANKAEVLQALDIANKNLSFGSTQDDNDWFCYMFRDSTIAKSYRMPDTKVQYLIKFGIANNWEKETNFMMIMTHLIHSCLTKVEKVKWKNSMACTYHIGQSTKTK